MRGVHPWKVKVTTEGGATEIVEGKVQVKTTCFSIINPDFVKLWELDIPDPESFIANKRQSRDEGPWPTVAINDNYKLQNDECCKKRKQTSLQKVLGQAASGDACDASKCPRDHFYVDRPANPSVCR